MHIIHYGGGSLDQSYGTLAQTNWSSVFGNHYWFNFNAGSISSANADAHIVTNSYSGSIDTVYVDGVSGGSKAVTLNTASSSMMIGSRISGPAETLVGDIAEIMVYNRALSATEQITAECYLSQKYNLSISNCSPTIMPRTATVTVNSELALSVSGGQSPYTYSMTSGSGSVNSSGLYTAGSSAGTATVQVVDSLGSVSTATIIVTSDSVSMINRGMTFHLDPAYGTGSAFPACTAASWIDLISGLSSTLTNIGNACASTSGWAGAGTAVNPYRLALDGTNDHVLFPASMTSGLTRFSINFWMRTSEMRTNGTYWNRPALFGSASSGLGSGDFGITTNGGVLGMWSGLATGADNSILSASTVDDNDWHHIAVTNDGSTIRLYLDGQSAATTSTISSTGVALHARAYSLGGIQTDGASPNYFHQADYGQFSFYNVALAAGDIARNCNALKDRFSGASCATYNPPTKLVLSGSASIARTFCYGYTVTSADAGSGAVSVSRNVTINLSGKGAGTFYSDSSCSTAVDSVTLPADSSSTTFYFKDDTVEGLNFVASDAYGALTTSAAYAVTVINFSPQSISGLLAWYTADALSLNDGDEVASWTDSSGNANHAVQSTSARRPIYKSNIVNGQPVVRFSYTNNSFMSFTSRLTTVQTIFVVTKHNGVGAADYPFMFGDPSSYDFHGESGAKMFSAYAHSFVRDGAGYVNGVSTAVLSIDKPSSFANIAVVTTGNTTIGFLSQDRNIERAWDGDIAEILIYSAALSTTDRQAIESYLRDKYSLP
jgi:hypothetical protein